MTRDAPLLDADRLTRLPELLAGLHADAWLLYDFHDANPLAGALLGPEHTSRRAFAFLPANGQPVLLRHAIETSAWTRWPWEVRTYAGWNELASKLADLLAGVDVVAMEVSPEDAVPALDRVPAGVVELVRKSGVRVVSSGELITAFHSLWPPQGLELHREAARVVRATAMEAFDRARVAAAGSNPVTEAALANWIRGRLRDGGLTEQEDCIVAMDANTSDPHYRPRGEGKRLEEGALVLIDAWGCHPHGGIPADQTWMGVLASHPSSRAVEVWEAVRDARDRALAFLSQRSDRGEDVRGFEVDRVARGELEERGFGAYFVHRLGHSIDGDLHGSGPDLDSLETRDERRLLPGVGFSVEPGVYIPGELGMRSEVNVYWGPEGPEVTPEEIQHALLLFPPG